MLGRLIRSSCQYSNSACVVLSGCGYGDGAEITEAVSTVINLWKKDISVTYYSIDKPQHHVLNHISFEEEIQEKRNVLLESTRISRDPVYDLSDLEVDDFDMLIFPGGFGVAKNLSNFAFCGEDFEIEDVVEKAIMDFSSKKKPIGCVCISPILLAKLFGGNGVKLTLGDSDEGINEIAANFGAEVIVVGNDEVVVCEKNKVVTTPAYMSSDANPSAAFDGIAKMIEAMIELL